VVDSCEHGNEPLGSIKAAIFDHTSNCQFFKKIDVPWINLMKIPWIKDSESLDVRQIRDDADVF
jgi:hypothetical protein